VTKRPHPHLRIVTDTAQVGPVSGDRAQALLDQFNDLPEALREALTAVDRRGRARYYALDANGEPTPANILQWGQILENHENQVVAQDVTPRGQLSTVFLGLDHAWSGPPMIYETALFPQIGSAEILMHYSTPAQARAGHAAYLAWAMGTGPDPEEIES
jgi:hypothetical protein